jgi:FixJ family two-component response regulator
MVASAVERPRALFVDDEQNVLNGIARVVRTSVDAEVCTSPKSAMRLLEDSQADGAREFAVVVSDMRMPEMDGAELLKHANEVAPDTTRMLLTGFTDLQSAVAAVNEGNIFRLLTKPCSTLHLNNALKAAVKQHMLIRDRRELLDLTLRGAVEALIETLAMAHPAAFARASRLRRLVGKVTDALDLPGSWQVEVAAQLGEIGVVTLPPVALDALMRGVPASHEILQMLEALPGLADTLLKRIPRLEGVREIVRAQEPVEDPDADLLTRASRAARVLQTVREYDAMMARGLASGMVIQILRQRAHHEPDVIDALQAAVPSSGSVTLRRVDPTELKVGDVLAADLRAANGTLLLSCGQVVTEAMLVRVSNFESLTGLDGKPLVAYES